MYQVYSLNLQDDWFLSCSKQDYKSLCAPSNSLKGERQRTLGDGFISLLPDHGVSDGKYGGE